MKRPFCLLIVLVVLVAALPLSAQPGSAPAVREPVWTRAWRHGPLTAEETKKFIRELAQFVFDNHLKKDQGSAQRGMVYEYYDTPRRGQFDRFVQGEALDTMHDGAWLCAALANAHRATGDAFYKDFLTQWTLPFYGKMLNHSDTLFSLRNAVWPEGGTPWGKEWMFQEGEKGFVPYWWDDGGSVSLERRSRKSNKAPFPCVDETAGKPGENPQCLLQGYSLGSSNHMAQDLGVMLQSGWLLLRDSPADKALAGELAEAARNLHESRMRHHGMIPMCFAPYALTTGSAAELAKLPDGESQSNWTPANQYVTALHDFNADQAAPMPGFADDQQYRYYYTIARSGGKLPRPLAFKLIYDAFTERMLYRCYCDDGPTPPGINVFDLYPYQFRNGKPTDYRSDHKGPHGRPKPVGSRMGPQSMIQCGVALQALRAWPGIWLARHKEQFPDDLWVPIVDLVPDAPAATVPATRPVSPRSEKVMVGGQTVSFYCTRDALFMVCQATPGKVAQFKLFNRPNAQGTWAQVTVSLDVSQLAVVNEHGNKFLLGADTGSGKVSIGIPFTVAKGQAAWANGIEHGRLSVQAGGQTRNLYLASPEEQVKAWLEYELGCGLRTWESVFKHMGYVPTGMGTMTHWDNYSDTGGYAHLISAGSQWLLYLGGACDWEAQKVPAGK